MEISKDFEEFFALLNENEVDYLVIGGYAYAVHAEPRYTKDLDIFFNSEERNAQKILIVLDQFGFGSLDVTIKDLVAPEQVIQLGFPPFRIDLLSDITGVSFDKAEQNRITAEYGDETIFVIGRTDLIANKKASGRDQDLVDVKRLMKE